MNMTARDMDAPGVTLLARDASQPHYVPPPTTGAARVEVWKRDRDKGIDTAVKVAETKPGGEFSFDFNPVTDRNALFATISYSASGVASTDLSRAEWTELVVQRETEAPTVTQAGPATQTEITLEISDYTQFAIRRKVRVADNALMTGATTEVTEATGAGLSRTVVINRADTETDAQTIYVRVSHSSSLDGPFGAESEVQEFTFADSLGAGGSSGEGDPYGRDRYVVL